MAQVNQVSSSMCIDCQASTHIIEECLLLGNQIG